MVYNENDKNIMFTVGNVIPPAKHPDKNQGGT